jgi:hypothetical protein
MDHMTMTEATLGRAAESLEAWWAGGYPWRRYLAEEVTENRVLWEGVYRKAKIPDRVLEELALLERSWNLLAIAEDWCGDASNLVPVFARLAGASPYVELRVVNRDENPELMDRYLTNGSRSIPIVVVLDERYRPVGRWGPRPAELQEFVIREKRAGKRPAAEIYKDTRQWYARDRGKTTLRELLDILVNVA